MLFYFYYFKQYFAIFSYLLFLAIVCILEFHISLTGLVINCSYCTSRTIEYKLFWYLKTLNTFLKGILLV